MTSLFQAVTNSGLTANGMTTNLSSSNACVDLFFAAGASRGSTLAPQFKAAFAENQEVATRILLWMRDAREGAGERQQFRSLLTLMIRLNPEFVAGIIPKIPELGRWDDVLALFGTKFEEQAIDLIKAALVAGVQARDILATMDELTEDQCETIYNIMFTA